MSRSTILLAFAALLLISSPLLIRGQDEYGDEDLDAALDAGAGTDDVAVITVANWETVVASSKFALIEFYAPWCGHCKTLAPHYVKAAAALKKTAPHVVIGKVDATVEAALGTRFKVSGYPTLKWFVDGVEASDYNGGRDAEGLIKWVSKKTGPPALTVSEVDELEAMEDKSEVTVLGYFSAFEGPEYEAFTSVAAKSEDVLFGQTTDKAVAAAAGITAAPGLAVVKNFPGEAREVASFDGKMTADGVKVFVLGEKLPLTLEFSQANSEKIFNSGISKQMILVGAADLFEPSSEVFSAYKVAAKKFKGQLVFVTVNNEATEAEPVIKFFDLKEAAGAALVGFVADKNSKFRAPLPLTVDSVTSFGQSLIDGTLVQEYKSAAVLPHPEDKDGHVQIVVGKSVDSIVFDKTKDVLLEVYAPWYRQRGDRHDGRHRERAPLIEAKGYPSLIFFPAGEDTTPVVFDGKERSLAALTKFIKKSATIDYELAKKEADAAAPPPSGKDEL
ncbi:MAG: hypothetical protein WDW36_001020 [Sanguina aurantia]